MQNPDCPPDVLQRYGTVLSRFEHAGATPYSNRIQQTLAGLGFAETDLPAPPHPTFRRPQRHPRRLARSAVGRARPICCWMNPAITWIFAAGEWLEAWLRDWNGAVVIVSHDRYFLDQTASQVWEMTPALEVYRGNYTAYLTQREARYTRRLAEFEAQNEYIEKQEDYIRRFLGTQ
jgi:ATP-binding cassette subfamily F protein 3